VHIWYWTICRLIVSREMYTVGGDQNPGENLHCRVEPLSQWQEEPVRSKQQPQPQRRRSKTSKITFIRLFSIRLSKALGYYTSLRNCAPLPQVQSMGYCIGRAVTYALPPARYIFIGQFYLNHGVALLTVWSDWPPCFTVASDARCYRFGRR
jgi:hypothetical protein